MYRSPEIEGWMRSDELEWLYERSREMETVAEIGCFKGRSTHALLSGRSYVTAVDHFLGSAGEIAHAVAAKDDGIYRIFCANVGHFWNLSVVRRSSIDAAAMFADGAFDMVFLDAGHSYEEVKADILAWRPKARRLLCGHDFCASWPEVMQAVTDTLGPVDVHGTIWIHWK